jgi:hypothetical protein
MAFNSNHDDDGRSSSSSTCLPAGFQGIDAEENGEYGEEVYYSTVAPTQNAGHFLLSPMRTVATRYPLRSTPERINAAAALTLATLSRDSGRSRASSAARGLAGRSQAPGRGRATNTCGRGTAAAVPTAAAGAAGTATAAHGRGGSATAGANTMAPAGANTMAAFVGAGVRG